MLKRTGIAAALLLGAIAFADDGPITGMKVDLDELVRVGRVLPVQGMSSAGAPDEAALRVFRDNGYVAVIDLRSDAEKSDDSEAKIAFELGLAYESLPIAGEGAVNFDNARRLAELTDRFNGPVLVHCASGNRVGALVALQQSLAGADDDLAIAAGKAAGLTSLESVVRTRLMEAPGAD